MTSLCEGGMERIDGGSREDFFQYFQNTWLDGNFPIRMWNVYSLEGPCTNNNTEGWHSKLRKLAGKAHPNIYEAVTLFKSEQAATEVSCSWLQADCQPGGGNTDFMRKDWQQSKRSTRQVTTPSVNFSKLTAIREVRGR